MVSFVIVKVVIVFHLNFSKQYLQWMNKAGYTTLDVPSRGVREGVTDL